MATPDSEQRDRHARDIPSAWITEPAAWFGAAIIGMIVVFIGLAIDAWRHNNGAGEESLLSFSNPGHLVAGIGLIGTSAALLIGLSVSTLKGAETAQATIRRFVPVTAAWVAVAAIGVGSITYIAASGVTVGHGEHADDTAAVAADHPHNDGGDAGVAQAVKDAGVDLNDPGNVPGALNQGASGQADGHHDKGKHPTFTQLQTMTDDQLLPMFPAETVAAANLPSLRNEVAQVREIAKLYPTVASANAAGFFNTTSDVPFMGQHFINREYLLDGKFDPSKPEGLLYSKVDGGPEKLVGVWFLQIPGIGDTTIEAEPVGFAGNLDLWHAHIGLCLVGTAGASEGETQEGCEAKGGDFTADLRWMMHVWVAPETTENQDGFFAYLNNDLYEKQVAAKTTAEAPSGTLP